MHAEVSKTSFSNKNHGVHFWLSLNITVMMQAVSQVFIAPAPSEQGAAAKQVGSKDRKPDMLPHNTWQVAFPTY